MVIPPYSVTSNKDLARFQVGNPWAGAGGGCYIASDGTLQHSLDPYILWGVSNTKLRVAFRQMGMVTRFSVGRQELVGRTLFIFRGIPVLQHHRELFIQGSLGNPGLVQGPGSHVQETLRRVVVSAPSFALNVDQATSVMTTFTSRREHYRLCNLCWWGLMGRQWDCRKELELSLMFPTRR